MVLMKLFSIKPINKSLDYYSKKIAEICETILYRMTFLLFKYCCSLEKCLAKVFGFLHNMKDIENNRFK